MAWTLTASAAYRADIDGRSEPFGAHDSDWITVASVLQHATLVESPTREELVASAIELAREAVGDEAIERFQNAEWQNRDTTQSDAIMALADSTHALGAFNIGAAILDAFVEVDVSLSAVQKGRAMARRARIAAKAGADDDAANRYREVQRLGVAEKSDELLATAWIGLGSVAQSKGNYPKLRSYTKRALGVAQRQGFRNIERQAHTGLMIAAATFEQFDEALEHGWASLQCAGGRPDVEAQAIQNIGQLLLQSGHPSEARAAFAYLVSRELPALVVLAALGGLALASAALNDERTIRWAAGEVARANINSAPRFPMAMALLECARAFADLRCINESIPLRDMALELAEKHSYHEITYRAELLADLKPSNVEPRPFNTRSVNIAREIAWMEPRRLPDHVLIASAAT